ncbi:RHS repeat-associated core domain-containing protein [Micromonosporaceae bacterium Da 78-11]
MTTTQQSGTQYVDANGTTVNAELVTKTTNYNWDLRKDTTVTTDPGAAPNLNLVERTSYNDAGLVTSLTRPGGGGVDTTAYTTRTTYYRAGTGSGYTECDARPEWANLVCRTDPAGQPASGPALATTVTTYNYYLQEATVTEKTSAGILRTTTTTYDQAERVATIAVTGATGEPVSTTRSVVDPATGHISQVQAVGSGNTVLAQTTVGFDALDRESSYSTPTRPPPQPPTTCWAGRRHRPAHWPPGRTPTTRTVRREGCRPRSWTRGPGTITASYDADGRVATETWPTGITVTHTYDAAGPTGLTYTKPGCGQSDCTLYSDAQAAGSNGLAASTVSPFSTETYTFDAAQRLTTVQDVQHSSCTTRAYTYNAAGDRTGMSTYLAGQDGGCQTATAGTTRTWAYNTADRITNAGYQYDVLGDATALPAEDTQTAETGALTMGYYVNGRTRSITQNGTSATYVLDAGNERVRSWTDALSRTHVNHYTAANQKEPVWTDEGDGTRTMPIEGLVGIAGIATVGSSSTAIAWRLGDLDGDLVATVAGSDLAVSAFTLTDEYGTLEDSAQAGSVRYAWLGGNEHAADNPGGLVSMGSRTYNPVTGSFTTPDPIAGGGSSRYGYCGGDPLGCRDPSGEGECTKVKKWGVTFFWTCGKVTNDWISDKPGEIAHHRNSRGKPSSSSG